MRKRKGKVWSILQTLKKVTRKRLNAIKIKVLKIIYKIAVPGIKQKHPNQL